MKLLTPSGFVYVPKRPTRFLCNWGGKSRSKFQREIKNRLKPHWERDVVFEEFPLPKKMSLDFLNISRKIAVEVQGNQHQQYVKHFHGNKMGYIHQLKRDSYKAKFCDANGIVLVEIYPEDLNEDLEDIFARHGVEL